MKTLKTKLIASIIVLATVTATTSPALSQRRTSQNNGRMEETRSTNNRTVREKSTNRKDAVQKQDERPENSRNRRVTTNNRSNQNTRQSNPNVQRPSSQERRSVQQNTPRTNTKMETTQTDQKPAVRRSTPAPANSRTSPGNRPVRERIDNNSEVRRNSSDDNPTARARSNQNRNIYRLDKNDKRYVPSSNFKGSNRYWATEYAKNHVHYKNRNERFYRNYNHRKYNHWDPHWETYRWNMNSWYDYYNGYHPQSYRFHKYYYHHPVYGHVIRKFSYRPVYFVHNNARYYDYDGHFFRYFRGIGYVLVDIPYGIVFHQLPDVYERVYINGYLYFRIGNLFFEMNSAGFSLVHYPERYYALQPEYYNGGYYSDDYMQPY